LSAAGRTGTDRTTKHDRRLKVAETYNGYCVKCKEKRDFEGEVSVSESGRKMAKGICPVCGTKMNRILGKA
jgi:ssDNA-binding Zn-finger/Zn-ribbon topoisomerase 1